MTALKLLLELHLGESLDDFLQRERSFGSSCREIASTLESETGLKVSKSAVHRWLHEQRRK